MAYPYYPNLQSQPFALYNLQGVPTGNNFHDDNQRPRNHQGDDLEETLASLVRITLAGQLSLSIDVLTVARAYRVIISLSTLTFAFRTPLHRALL
jgi:hypothetical protein